MSRMLRKRHLPFVAVLSAGAAKRKKGLGVAAALVAGAAVAVVPGLASGQSGAPSSASFKAIDSAGVYGSSHSWQSDSGSNQATIAQGGTVSFAYSVGAAPQGSTMHNADFSGPAAPVCTQTQGANSGAVPPLPHQPTGPGWAGSCSFATAGTYTFHCDLHTDMTGTIVVQGSGSPPATTTTSTTDTGPGATPPGTTGASVPPGAALASVAVASHQKGHRVRGSALVGQAGSTLEVDLTASGASLARSHKVSQVSAGRLVRRGVGPGQVSFAVSLNARATSALRRHARLALAVKLRVTAPAGRAGTTTKRVILSR